MHRCHCMCPRYSATDPYLFNRPWELSASYKSNIGMQEYGYRMMLAKAKTCPQCALQYRKLQAKRW